MENTDEIKINILEVSCCLADNQLFAYYKRNNNNIFSIEQIENLILVEDEGGVLIYTEDAQKLFNNYYDEWYSVLENLAIK